MALISAQMALFSVICFFLAFVQFSSGCSPIPGKKPPTLEERFFYSDYVVYGRVTAHYPEPKPMYDSVYIADLTVYCTFKGSVLPTRINVSDAGFVPGLCHSTNLTTGKEYVVFLSQQDNKYTPTYKEDLPNDQYLEEIGLLCEHDINYPQGLDESTATMMCPDNYPDYPDCIRYTEPEPDTEPEVKPLDKNTPIVEVTKPGEVSGDGGKEINDGGNGGSGVMNVTCLLAYICVFVSLWL